MRSGLIISAASHAVLVSLALFGTPKLFDATPTPSIEVDLVRPEEIPVPPDKPKEEKTLSLLPETRLPQAQAPAPSAQADPRPAQSRPPAQTQSAAGPQTPPLAPQPPARPSIFEPENIPALLNLPNSPDRGFDAEAMVAAKLSDEERGALKAQIKKCWRLPDGVAATQTARVVLRVNLRRDGSLAAEPMLIEAPASRDGPALLQAATRALKECQPFAFLPADKYREWRILDLSFSPRDMAGG